MVNYADAVQADDHVFDSQGVRVLVDLDGGWGEAVLHRHLDLFKAAAPERFRLHAVATQSAADRLARDGIRFEQAYTPTAHCCPARSNAPFPGG